MEQLLSYILNKIVKDPDTITITKETDELTNELIFNISVPEEERGIIIGKQGKNIQAIRNIISIIARREGQRVRIKILD
jgi:predicted RNA-binding protein YlqC (UPF0109 family)